MAAGREGDLYAEQLAFTNDRIREIVEVLLDRPPEERPIIVLSGDEGPFICGNIDCVDDTPEAYGIRFGSLRAYYLPGLDYEVPADDTGVNIFRMLFREYFGADLPDLPNRSYTGRTTTISTTSGTSPRSCRCRELRRARLEASRARLGRVAE